LLTGQPAAPDRRGLSRLLTAAAAPARPDELAGERAAVDGFRRVYRPEVPRRRRIGPALRRTALVKATAGAAVVFLGGAAVAAQTGALPEPAQQSAHDLLGAPAPRHRGGDDAGGGDHGSTPPGAVPAAPGPAGTATPDRPPTGAPPSPTPAPPPDLAQLCHAYLEAQSHHQAPDPEVRERLAAAAGGSHKITPFCVKLSHAHPSTPPSDGDGDPGHRPKGRPTGPPPH